jgi:hypothetical protein
MCLAGAGAKGLRASGRHGSLTAEGLDLHCPNGKALALAGERRF